MSAPTYVTTRGRRIASLFLGAVLGGVITAFPITVITSKDRIVDNLSDLLLSLAICVVIWLVGIAAFAFPIWLLIERRRESLGWRTAAVCGLVLAPIWFVIVILIFQALLGEDPGFWRGNMGFALAFGAILFALPGCVVALAMWRFAYRRTIPSDVAEAFS